MEREIKFRAWSENSKVMLIDVGFHPHMAQDNAADDPYYETHEEGRWTVTPSLGYKIMQYTGLKDKNGKEIWEGDVVSGLLLTKDSKDLTLPTMGLIEYCNGFGAFCVRNDAGQTLFHNHILGSFEILGNIFENPKLI